MWRKGGDDDDGDDEKDPSGCSRRLWRDRPKANAKEVQDPPEADGHLQLGVCKGWLHKMTP